MKIKIQTGSLNQKQVDNLIEDKNTINLSNRMSTKQMEQKRAIRKEKLLFKKYWKEILTLAILFIWVLIAIIQLLGNNVTYANENTPDPYFIPMESVVDREAFCENLSFTDYERYIKDCKEFHKITKDILDDQQGLHTTIQWGTWKQPIHVWDTRVNYLIEQGFTLTEVIDITTLWTTECMRYDWKCINTSDIWPMQINRIAHREAYFKSKDLFYNSAELYKYQIKYVKTEIIDDLNNRFCGWEYAETNEQRFKCLARNYNWNTKIYSNWKQGRDHYKELAWAKRDLVAQYIVKNYPLLAN